MQLQLAQIKPSPHPIRSSWDEDKMQELVESIKEQGLIVPIKVRPTENEHYEIVYGHRRVEACRRAGMYLIDAWVEGLEDTDALIQALIENVQREDMEPMDLARALATLQNITGWSQRQIAEHGIMKRSRIQQILALLSIPADIQQLVVKAPGGELAPGKVTEVHIREALAASQDDHSVVIDAIRKAAAEGLTAKETRMVAEAVAQAEDEAEREAILSTDPTDPAFDRLVRVRADIHREQQREQQRKRQDDPREVKAFLDSVRAFRAVCREAVAIVDYGKFSPEARRFAIRQLDQLLEDIQALKQSLEV